MLALNSSLPPLPSLLPLSPRSPSPNCLSFPSIHRESITMMSFANKRLGKYRYVVCVCMCVCGGGRGKVVG